MTPRIVYVAFYQLEDGKQMPAITTPRCYEAWKDDSKNYSERIVGRWNARAVTHGRHRQKLVGFHIERYFHPTFKGAA